MTPFAELVPIGRGVFLSAALLLCFFALYAFIGAAALRLGRKWLGGGASLLVTACLLQQWAYDIAWRAEAAIPSRPPAQIPAAAFVLALAALSLFTALFSARLSKLRRMRLSSASVKEGIDHLPTGLCFYEESGRVLLINRAMHDLCHEMTGEALLDAKAFWEALLSGSIQGGVTAIQGAPSPIWMFAGGDVVHFERRELTLKRRRLFQITATDVAAQHRLGLRLREDNQHLLAMNERLRQHSKTVREVTREGEILAAKVSLHDELGRISLAARRAMQSSASYCERAALLENWRRNVALVYPQSNAAPRATGFEQLADVAKAIGVSVYFRGMLPPIQTDTARLMESALRECLTNTIRHAEGTELYVDIQKAAAWTLALTNNGRIPSAPVAEGSGLGGLRANIEHVGGTMRVQHAPRFQLTITLPMESEDLHDEIQGDDRRGSDDAAPAF